MPKYRKKPVEIEAMRFDGSKQSANHVLAWIGENGADAKRVSLTGPSRTITYSIAIDTLEGTMSAAPGDYVIRGVQGEFYPCKPDIFAATYDEVTAVTEQASSVCMLYPGPCDRPHAGGMGGVPVHPPAGARISGDEPLIPTGDEFQS